MERDFESGDKVILWFARDSAIKDGTIATLLRLPAGPGDLIRFEIKGELYAINGNSWPFIGMQLYEKGDDNG